MERVRDLVRKIEPLYQELRLDAPEVSDDDILDAMAKSPALINRPIVATEIWRDFVGPVPR